MKILEKIKKLAVGLGTFLLTLPTKVMAVQDSIFVNVPKLQGNPAVYGVPRTRPILMIWRVARTFVIPIALLIGLIVYFKKSKSSKKKKIFVSIGVIILTVLVVFTINAIIYLNEHF